MRPTLRDDRANSALERFGGAEISVFIMTFDEEVNIERCLASIAWSNDIVILDSYSRDRTVELAAAFPDVRIYQRAFDDYGSQRNHGLHRIAYRNPWVLVLDADETVDPALAVEMIEVARGDTDSGVQAFMIQRRVVLNNRRLRWNLSSGFWIVRLVRPEAVDYEGTVHERVRLTTPAGRLKGKLAHHQFDKGVDNWLARRVSYARMEAEAEPAGERRLIGLFSRDPLLRRAALKAVFRRLPARWAIYFIYSWVFRMPFLDGREGLRYVFLEAYSHYLAARALKENDAQARQTSPASGL